MCSDIPFDKLLHFQLNCFICWGKRDNNQKEDVYERPWVFTIKLHALFNMTIILILNLNINFSIHCIFMALSCWENWYNYSSNNSSNSNMVCFQTYPSAIWSKLSNFCIFYFIFCCKKVIVMHLCLRAHKAWWCQLVCASKSQRNLYFPWRTIHFAASSEGQHMNIHKQRQHTQAWQHKSSDWVIQ